VVMRRGREKTVCARGASLALLGGPSTSPLDRATERQHSVTRLANLVLTVVIFAAVWSAYSRYRHHTIHPSSSTSSPQTTSSDSDSNATETHESPIHCDGRTYCSQMTSCSEAKYFLAHCPDVKMDGDHDGIPCETQWCPNG